MHTNKKKIGLIGLGGITHMGHLRAFQELDSCVIAAGCDIDTDKFDFFKEVISPESLYTNHLEMLDNEELDAVVVGTPNNTHKDISIDALRRGIPVMCEKPVAMSSAEALEIKSVVDETGVKFMIGLCFRFRNQTKEILKLIENGQLGEIYYCKACYMRQRGIPGFGTWFTDKSRSGGGVILDLGVHMIDYLWYLLGKPEFSSVSAITSGAIGQRIQSGEQAGFPGSDYPETYKGIEQNIFDVDDMGSIFIRFANGVAANIELSWAMNIDQGESRGAIFGNRGGVTLNPVVLTTDKNNEMVSEEMDYENVPSHNNQAKEFIRYLNDEIPNPAPIEDGITVMKVLEAVYKSADEKKEVLLGAS